MSTKSKRRTRRTCKSSNSDSPLPTPSSAQRKFKNSVAFEFECEPLQDTSLSSVFTDKEESIIKSKKSTKNRLVKKTKILENQPEEPDSTTNTISDLEIGASIQDLSKISITKTRKTKKPKRSIFKLPDISNSITSESSDPSDEKVPKKPKKKTIRYTQDLNAFQNEDRENSIASKAKPKKVKKARLPSFLPPVDSIDEDKIKKTSKSSDTLTTDSDNKENDSISESTDTEKRDRKSRKCKSKKTKKKLGNFNLELPVFGDNEATSGKVSTKPKDNIFNNLLDNINVKSPWSSTSGMDKKVKTPLKRKSTLRSTRISKSETDIAILAHDNKTLEDKELQQNVFEEKTSLSVRLSRTTSFVSDTVTNNEEVKIKNDSPQQQKNFDERSSLSGKKELKGNGFNVSLNCSINKISREGIKVKLEDLQSNPAIIVKNPTPRKSKTKRNTFDVDVKEQIGTCGEDMNENLEDLESNDIIAKNLIPRKSKTKRNKFDVDVKEETGTCGEEMKENLEDIESNAIIAKNPTPRKSKTKRNTFDVDVKEQSNTCGKDMNEHSEDLKCNAIIAKKTTPRKSKTKRNTFDLDVKVQTGTCGEDITENSEDLENKANIAKNPTPRKSKTKRNTFDMEVKDETGSYQDNDTKTSNDESNIITNETSTSKSSKRATYNIMSNLDDVFRQPDRVASPRKRLTGPSSRAVPDLSLNKSSASPRPGFRASETISRPSNSSKVITPRKATRASKVVAKDDLFDGAKVRTPKLKREDTFDVVESSQKQEVADSSGLSVISRRDTFLALTSRPISSSEEDASIIDLTESLTEDSEPSPRKKLKRSTLDQGSSGKSSFEVSFKVRKGEKSSEEILDHLNITRRDSGKSDTKSGAGLFRSSVSDDEDFKRGNFVTLRRGFQTMSVMGKSGDDFKKGAGNLDRPSWNGVVKNSSEAAESPSKPRTAKKAAPKKSILKKAGGSKRRDTFEVAEIFYEALENGKQTQYKPTIPIVIESTPGKTTQSRDTFDLIKNTPTAKLDKMMLDGESFLLSDSILDDSNQSMGPSRLTASIFTKKEGAVETPQPRKSNRKRWSQVERTPIFEKMPRGTPSTSKADLQTTLDKSKSVSVFSPPERSISTRKSTFDSSLKIVDSARKGKKSVKIETPLKTPKIRLHSPLIIRKTPRPAFSAANSSILSGNCAGPSVKFSPPSGTSTPYHKKKEVSLLQKVLTNEKSKTDKILAKNSTKKMPNFAKIHQRHFNQMENIKEMQERKALRAQFLLSGNKPPPNTDASRTEDKESRKQLKFSPARADPSTSKNISATSKNAKELSKPVKIMLEKQKKRASLEKKKKATKSKVPVPVTVAVKQQPVAVVPTQTEKPKAVTRFGFKLPKGKENVTKEEQIKAVTSKSKVAANTTEKNRNIQGNVRTNRRFELLMKMRQKQNRQAVKIALSKDAKKDIRKDNRNNIQLKSVETRLLKDTAKSSKPLSKPLQQMLNRKAMLEKKKINDKKETRSKIPIRILRPRIKNKEEEQRGGYSRFGFKLPAGKENTTKVDQIKAVLSKTRIPNNRTEENRREMGRVRSNRRFELLMSLRERNV